MSGTVFERAGNERLKYRASTGWAAKRSLPKPLPSKHSVHQEIWNELPKTFNLRRVARNDSFVNSVGR